jgi:hypothetical protein
MLSNDQAKRDHARKTLFGNKDFGFAWLRSGWKEEENADTLGLDIGHDFANGSATEEAEWVKRASLGMDKVVEGLSVF